MSAKTPKNIRPDRRNISGQKAEKFLAKKPKNIDESRQTVYSFKVERGVL